MAIPFRTAALAFALLLAACSGGGEAESTPAGSDGTPEASTAAPSAPGRRERLGRRRERHER